MTNVLTTLKTKSHYWRQPTAIIFDWAGTLVDSGSRSPIIAFQSALHKHGLVVPTSDIAKHMGMGKRAHLEHIFKSMGLTPKSRDVDRIYADYQAEQLELLKMPEFTQPLRRVESTLKYLQTKYDIQLGLTTGFNDLMHKQIIKTLTDNGSELPKLLNPNLCIPTESPIRGRPYPDALRAIKRRLHLDPMREASQVWKIDDTRVGLEEGLYAKCTSIGVYQHSNYNDSTLHKIMSSPLEVNKYQTHVDGVAEELNNAHLLLPSVADLPWAIERYI
jgi:phosphonoacetaldehyde hydrolase